MYPCKQFQQKPVRPMQKVTGLLYGRPGGGQTSVGPGPQGRIRLQEWQSRARVARASYEGILENRRFWNNSRKAALGGCFPCRDWYHPASIPYQRFHTLVILPARTDVRKGRRLFGSTGSFTCAGYVHDNYVAPVRTLNHQKISSSRADGEPLHSSFARKLHRVNRVSA
jgi:hypothetical protein